MIGTSAASFALAVRGLNEAVVRASGPTTTTIADVIDAFCTAAGGLDEAVTALGRCYAAGRGGGGGGGSGGGKRRRVADDGSALPCDPSHSNCDCDESCVVA